MNIPTLPPNSTGAEINPSEENRPEHEREGFFRNVINGAFDNGIHNIIERAFDIYPRKFKNRKPKLRSGGTYLSLGF